MRSLFCLLALSIFMLGLWRQAMAEDSDIGVAKPEISIRYIYLYCNDLLAMRHFYTDLVGMQESAFRNDEQWAWLCYTCGSFEFMIFPSDKAVAGQGEYSMQPGWGGTLPTISWSVRIPEDKFAEVVQRLIDDGVPTVAPKPQWAQDSYWSFPVLDPMGNTVELYAETKTRPQNTEWPE
jgi:catechol-2,3-dioxygenase